MPLINGMKYSCEPCIRGHRATSCAHTDRILIEVRKPGRPLESCGHNLATCNCGKLAGLFSMGGEFSALPNSQISNIEEQPVVITTPPLVPSSRKPKAQDRASRNLKKNKHKKNSPRFSPLTSNDRDPGTSGTNAWEDQNSQIPQQQDFSGPDYLLHSTSEHQRSPEAMNMHSTMQSSPLTFNQSLPSHQPHQYPYGHPQPVVAYRNGVENLQASNFYSTQSSSFSSRIEDIVIGYNAPRQGSEHEDISQDVRSRYFVATPDARTYGQM